MDLRCVYTACNLDCTRLNRGEHVKWTFGFTLMLLIAAICAIIIRVEILTPAAIATFRTPTQALHYGYPKCVCGVDFSAYASHLPANCSATLLPNPNELSHIEDTIIIHKDGSAVFSFTAHNHTPFLIDDDCLYYVDYCPIANGATLHKVNLKNGSQLFEQRVVGIGPVDHSKYSNVISMRLAASILVIQGQESAGSYVEMHEKSDGRKIGLTILPLQR